MEIVTLNSLSPALFAWWACAFVIAGVIYGTIGFGFPFIATPLIAMTTDIRTTVIVVLLPTLVTTGLNMALSGPLAPVLARFWTMPIYSLLGSLLGTWLFVTAPGVPYSLLLALLTLFYLNADRITRGEWPRIRRNEQMLAPIAAITSGVFEGTVNVGGPPLIIYYLALGLPTAMLVQALNLSFLVGKVAQLAVLTTRGAVDGRQWVATLPFVAFGAAAFFLGLRIRSRVDAQTFRTWVKRALFVIAATLLLQYVGSWF